MSIRRRVRRAFAWALSLALAIAAGGTIAAYYYVTDSDTLTELIRREAPRYLPGCKVAVLRARVRPFAGEMTLNHLSVREPGGVGGSPVARMPYLQVRYDPWAMTKGRFEPREVRLVKPTLRLARRADGTWNLQGLLADPWPGPKGGPLPPIRVQDGTVELAVEGDGPPLGLLREVSIEIPSPSGPGSPVAFELTAKGDLFDRVHLRGTVDPGTGRVVLEKGDLVRLTLSEALRGRLPAAVASALELVGLSGGEVDADLGSLSFDPAASPRLRYDATARLSRGFWKCPKLPFPISDVSVDLRARDGRPAEVTASGSDGATTFALEGKFDLDDPAGGPFEAKVDASGLQLDARLRGWTPPEFRELWDLYFPEVGRSAKSPAAGRVNVTVRASRPSAGAGVAAESDVELLDVAMKYKHFAYPVDHIRGKIHATARRLDLKVETLVGNKPLRVSGTVLDPGPRAIARLGFDVEALPVDSALFDALPPDVRKVVLGFGPTGTVRGHADLRREPPLKPGDDPRGRVRIDADIRLNPGCSLTWEGLKYPVMNLTGRLEIHPDLWVFSEMRGSNGQAAIEAGGRVEKVGVDPVKGDLVKVDMDLKARNLPFDHQLRDALPKPWQLTWGVLNPTGASDIAATIHVDPRRVDRNRIEITPRAQTGVNLRFNPLPVAGLGPPAGPLEMRMDDVTGRFVYDTATAPPTTMSGVGFTFQRAPVRFAHGQVDVKDSGAFGLGVRGLEVSDLRLDEGVRRMMPPVMAQLARRLDDRPLKRITTDLGLGWSGRAGESAWCKWQGALVVLSDNKVEIGTDLALEHIQGQLDDVRGSFDGRALEVRGRLDLDSVGVLGQQVTRLTAGLDVREGIARLDDVRGSVLGGALGGRIRSTMEVTPRYSANVSVDAADLHEYARGLAGHQAVKGLLSGWVEVSGQGYDPHTLTGAGEAHVEQGDLGHLPVALRFFNVLKLAKEARTAFDTAKVKFRIDNGETTLDAVQLFGNAFSLDGRGSVDVRGDVDVKLRILAGRDAWHVPLFSDVTRELSGQILVVRVLGPITAPRFRPEALPLHNEIFRHRHRPPRPRAAGAWGPTRTGLETRARVGPAS